MWGAFLALLASVAQAFGELGKYLSTRQILDAGRDQQKSVGLENENSALRDFAKIDAAASNLADNAINKRLRDDFTRD